MVTEARPGREGRRTGGEAHGAAARYTPVQSASSWRENRPEPPAHGLWAARPHTPFQYDAVRGKYQGFLRPKVPEKQDANRVSSATFYPERESVIGHLNSLVQLFHIDTFHTHPMSEPGHPGPRRPPRPAQGHGGAPPATTPNGLLTRCPTSRRGRIQDKAALNEGFRLPRAQPRPPRPSASVHRRLCQPSTFTQTRVRSTKE